MNKNKILLAAALATAGLVAVPAAFAQNAANPTSQQGWYVAANAGYAGIDKGPYDNGAVAGGVTGGYRFAINPATSLGVEVGYQYLGQVTARGLSSDSSADSKLRGTTAGLNLRYNISPSWYGELRGGAFYAQGQGLTDSANPQYQQFNRTQYYAGAGVGYNITPQLSMGLNYNYYNGTGRDVELQTSAYTVSAEYRF
ncbi:porin family protein [Dyella sp. S184]|jgi:opacity protein-like surface antigen|uniref:outer membrane protein n=1 Tax=Dyella sp. S184 TaxID=1641862 RepID=UPI00131E3317|nr:porin family protein [Dyella sp. S184]